jgi:RHS repeat-associated protein
VKTAGSAQAQQAVLNLRLPGQYFDEETGLHDNWHRSYDPRPQSPNHGRYLSPDPLGYPDGPDPYSYVNGDPVNKVDPSGLYSTEVHYYMTYFLARLAGLSEDSALTVAMAAQFVDNNPNTEPINPSSPFTQAERLATYHFTQAGYDPVQLPGESDEAYA